MPKAILPESVTSILEDFQEPGDSADNVSHSEHGFASTAEWRQLIAEAEALLVPLPEVQATEEAHKLRAAQLGRKRDPFRRWKWKAEAKGE